jgi:hypothetical protein
VTSGEIGGLKYFPRIVHHDASGGRFNLRFEVHSTRDDLCNSLICT